MEVTLNEDSLVAIVIVALCVFVFLVLCIVWGWIKSGMDCVTCACDAATCCCRK